jgi:hypothetical protein
MDHDLSCRNLVGCSCDGRFQHFEPAIQQKTKNILDANRCLSPGRWASVLFAVLRQTRRISADFQLEEQKIKRVLRSFVQKNLPLADDRP